MPVRQRPVFTTPEATEQAFYDCLRRADLEGLMQLWADDDSSCCLHPDGSRSQGFAAIKQSWQQVLERGPMQITPRVVAHNTTTVMAVHQVIEALEMADGQGRGVLLYVAATNIYLCGRQGWSIVLHHSSALANPETEADPSCTRH